jgi:oxygen-dependent protoporphyrinogen oxidase
VVLGGGISGLTAAYRLSKLGAEVQLLEERERTGGIVATRREGGRVLELGPDCFLTGPKPWARDLALELGLEAELQPIRTGDRRSFILTRKKLERVPEGFHLVAPTALGPFFESRILSRRGKLRALAELSIGPRPRGDESLRSFVVRRFGRELFERLAEPLVAGIYTADPEKLSLAATFPQFLDMEREHGSVLRALSGRRVEASGARYGLFLSLRGGIAALTDALRERLPPGVIVHGTRASHVRRDGKGFRVEHAAGVESAEKVIVALPAPEAARVLAPLDEELARALGAIRYASAGTLNFVLKREQVRHPLDGMGFVCPEVEERFILACSFSSTKLEGRAREGEVLLRAFIGGARHEDRLDLAPREVEARALADLDEILGISGPPVESVLHVMSGSMPQYTLGHLDRVRGIEALAARQPGVALAGNAYRGVGLPDCVLSAEKAVRAVTAP